MSANRILHLLGVVIHSMLFPLHIVGLVYNIIFRNRLYAAFHGVMTIFSGCSILHHFFSSRRFDGE